MCTKVHEILLVPGGALVLRILVTFRPAILSISNSSSGILRMMRVLDLLFSSQRFLELCLFCLFSLYGSDRLNLSLRILSFSSPLYYLVCPVNF